MSEEQEGSKKAAASRPSSTESRQPVIAVVEGRVVKREEGRIVLEVADGLIMEIPESEVVRYTELTDPKSGRGFVRLELSATSEDQPFVLSINPRLMRLAAQSTELPFIFRAGGGTAFAAGELVAEPSPIVEGEQSRVMLLTSMAWHGDCPPESVTAYNTGTQPSHTVWGTRNEDTTGDIGCESWFDIAEPEGPELP
jgi:hypothetical protein